MLMSFTSRVIGAWFAFLIPAYSTWKALANRPLSEPDLERWAMYWTCIGAFIAFESVAEWFISWFPFYWELRTLVLLFMSLPQTQGSTFVYKTYFEPYFRKNEADIDASIVSVQSNTLAFVQAKTAAIWETVWRIATKSTNAAAPVGQSPSAQQGSPASILSMGTNLFNTYGPWAMGAIKSSLDTAQSRAAAANTASQPPLPTPPATGPTPGPGLQQRTPYTSQESVVTPPSSYPNVPPTFPEPQHH